MYTNKKGKENDLLFFRTPMLSLLNCNYVAIRQCWFGISIVLRDSFQWHSSIVSATWIWSRIKGMDGKLPSKATRCANIRTIGSIMRARRGCEKCFGRLSGCSYIYIHTHTHTQSGALAGITATKRICASYLGVSAEFCLSGLIKVEMRRLVLRLLVRVSYRMQLRFLGAVPALFEHCYFRDQSLVELPVCRCARRGSTRSFDEASFKITNALFFLAFHLASL